MARRLVNEREVTSFAEAYDAYVWNVYGFFGYRVTSRHEAEDLTQITFENALRAWERYDAARSSVRISLMAIARNVLVDHYLRGGSARHQTIAVEDQALDRASGTVPGPEPTLSPDLERALGTLTQRDHEVLALRFAPTSRGARSLS